MSIDVYPPLPDTATWTELAQGVAASWGLTISEETANWVLWERTAFPMDTLDGVVRMLHEFFALPYDGDPIGWREMCENDASVSGVARLAARDTAPPVPHQGHHDGAEPVGFAVRTRQRLIDLLNEHGGPQ